MRMFQFFKTNYCRLCMVAVSWNSLSECNVICCPHIVELCIQILIHTYVFTGDIGNYYYGQGHPMKPHRIRMTHNLLLNYGLYRKMEIYVSDFYKQYVQNSYRSWLLNHLLLSPKHWKLWVSQVSFYCYFRILSHMQGNYRTFSFMSAVHQRTYTH